MTKEDLIAQLQAIPGNPVILIWDPDAWTPGHGDAGDWMPVTGFTYDEREVKLYTDVDDDEDEDDAGQEEAG